MKSPDGFGESLKVTGMNIAGGQVTPPESDLRTSVIGRWKESHRQWEESHRQDRRVEAMLAGGGACYGRERLSSVRRTEHAGDCMWSCRCSILAFLALFVAAP